MSRIPLIILLSIFSLLFLSCTKKSDESNKSIIAFGKKKDSVNLNNEQEENKSEEKKEGKTEIYDQIEDPRIDEVAEDLKLDPPPSPVVILNKLKKIESTLPINSKLKKVIKEIIKAKNSRNGSDWKSIEKLTKIREKSSVLILTKMLTDTDFWQLHEEIIEALGEIGDKSAVPALHDVLFKNRYGFLEWRCSIYNEVYTALEKIDGKSAIAVLIKSLRGNTSVVTDIIVRLNALEAIPELIKLLKDEDFSNGHPKKIHAASALGELKAATSIPFIIKAYIKEKEGNAFRHEYFLKALGEIGDKSVVPFLINEFDDSKLNERCVIARALGNICDKSALEFLQKVLKEHRNKDLRRYAKIAIDKIEKSNKKDE